MDRVRALWDSASSHTEALVVMKSGQVLGKAGFTRDDLDAIRQDLRMTVWQKLHLFDQSRGTLEAFVTTVIESAVKQMLRDRRRLKRGGGRRPVSLDGVPDIADKARLITGGRERRARIETVRRALAELPPDLHEAMLKLTEHSLAKASRSTNRTKRAVTTDRDLIREHLRRYGLDKEI